MFMDPFPLPIALLHNPGPFEDRIQMEFHQQYPKRVES
jgi:hypothetical protein